MGICCVAILQATATEPPERAPRMEHPNEQKSNRPRNHPRTVEIYQNKMFLIFSDTTKERAPQGESPGCECSYLFSNSAKSLLTFAKLLLRVLKTESDFFRPLRVFLCAAFEYSGE